jgi:hypothetical protein
MGELVAGSVSKFYSSSALKVEVLANACDHVQSSLSCSVFD